MALVPLPNNPSSSLPSAYLYLIFYPEDGTNPTPYYKRITTLAKGTGNWEKLELPHFTAPAKGRVEIFVVNESSLDVWFDDLKIEFEGALIAQETHYDPWGLELAGIGKAGLNRFTFNAQSEKQKDLNGGKGYFYETDFRGYDPQLGRFHGYDLLASAFSGITPYQFGFNNPVMFNDPTGLAPSEPVYNNEKPKNQRNCIGCYDEPPPWINKKPEPEPTTPPTKLDLPKFNPGSGGAAAAEGRHYYRYFEYTLNSDYSHVVTIYEDVLTENENIGDKATHDIIVTTARITAKGKIESIIREQLHWDGVMVEVKGFLETGKGFFSAPILTHNEGQFKDSPSWMHSEKNEKLSNTPMDFQRIVSTIQENASYNQRYDYAKENIAATNWMTATTYAGASYLIPAPGWLKLLGGVSLATWRYLKTTEDNRGKTYRFE